MGVSASSNTASSGGTVKVELEPSRGWVKAWRKIEDHPCYKDSEWVHVWLHLLLNATHQPWRISYCGKEITLQPGQLVTGRHSISESTGVHDSKVKRILTRLENDQQITRERSNKSSIITIVNWHLYQTIDQQSDQQNDQLLTSQRPATDQQLATNKNIKNIRTEEHQNLSTLKAPKGDLPALKEFIKGANEPELFEACQVLFEKSVMKQYGGSWRNRSTDEPEKLRRILVEVIADMQEGKRIRCIGAYANDLWNPDNEKRREENNTREMWRRAGAGR